MPFFSGRGRSAAPKPEFAVVGLGRFGASLARTLVAGGHTVLGIDTSQALVQRHSHEISQTVCLDATDEEALKEIDITSYGVVIVAIGNSFESSLMSVVALKAQGVQKVISKASTLVQGDILLKVGADRVVLPEYQAGEFLAAELMNPHLVAQIPFGGTWRVSEIRPKPEHSGKTLGDIDLKGNCGLDVLALARGSVLAIQPSLDTEITLQDLLLVAGSARDLASYADES
jgi:trk system potassium uptake protein